MLIAKNKTTGEFINCFQNNADEKTLIYNAGLQGIEAEEVECVEVNNQGFESAKRQYFSENPPEKKAAPTITCGECGTKSISIGYKINANRCWLIYRKRF